MAFSEFEQKRYDKAMRAYIEACRPAPNVRHQLDIHYRIAGQSIEIFEVRPKWHEPAVKIENPVAKAVYEKTSNRWKIYWMRGDLKWHRYEPQPQVQTIDEFIHLLDTDEYGCFWG